MPGRTRIAVVVGSLRRESFNRRVAQAAIEFAPPSLEFHFTEIADLPLYNEDLERATVPEAWTRFRADIKTADAILFVTPEYNRSVPGGLKNAVDVGSRPYLSNVWNDKPAAIISVSTGAIGAFGANHHLRQALTFVNAAVMPQPEAYIGGAKDLFGADGKIANEGTRKFLERFTNAFGAWIERVRVRAP